jgi:hypothetical protein
MELVISENIKREEGNLKGGVKKTEIWKCKCREGRVFSMYSDLLPEPHYLDRFFFQLEIVACGDVQGLVHVSSGPVAKLPSF